jgi:hypothetical protein
MVSANHHQNDQQSQIAVLKEKNKKLQEALDSERSKRKKSARVTRAMWKKYHKLFSATGRGYEQLLQDAVVARMRMALPDHTIIDFDGIMMHQFSFREVVIRVPVSEMDEPKYQYPSNGVENEED